MVVWETLKNFKWIMAQRAQHIWGSSTATFDLLMKFPLLECVLIPHEICTTPQFWKKYVSLFFYHSVTSKSFVTWAAPATKLIYRMFVKLMFILLFCNSQIDLLIGWELWYFLSDGSLISPLGVKWHFFQFMVHLLLLTPC